MNTEELFNKVISLKIEDENGSYVDYLKLEEKNKLNKTRKRLKILNALSKISLIVAIVSLIIIFILAGTSGDDFKIPSVIGFGFFIGIILASFFYYLFFLFNKNFKDTLRYYFSKHTSELYAKSEENISDISDVLYAISCRLTENNSEIMNTIINCLNDPKTYYLIHKSEIEKHTVNTFDENAYLISDIFNVLESNKKVAIISEDTTKEIFLNKLSVLDKNINYDEIIFNQCDSTDKKYIIANWISDINIYLKNQEKALMLFDFNKVYNNEIILFIININEVGNFVEIPGMVYINANEKGD